MSDDYSDSSNGPSFSDAPAPQIANAALRIAVTSRSADAANQIWQEIRRRIAKRGEFIALRTSGADAAASVFHLTADELASDEAARTAFETASRGAAPLNFIVYTPPKNDEQAARRLDQLLADLNKGNRFLKAPMSREADEAKAGKDDLLLQARGIANQLSDNPPPLSSVSLSEFAANEKEVKREAKANKKSAKQDINDKTPSASAKKADRKKPGKTNSGSAELSKENNRASRPGSDEKKEVDGGNDKAARAAERQNSKAQASAAVEPGQGQKKDKSAKKAALALAKAAQVAAKEARAAEREKRKAEKRAAAGPDAEQKKAARQAEHAAAKAAQVTEREKRKAEKRAEPPSEAAEVQKKDKSAKKAEHAAAKELRALEREQRKAEKRATAGPGAAEDKKAARQAEHATAKAAHAAEREKRKAEKRAASDGETEKRSEEGKSAARAERKARTSAATESGAESADRKSREKRKEKKDEPLTEEQKLERKKARAAEKEERKKGGSEIEVDGESSRTLRIALKGVGETDAQQLRQAVERQLGGMPVEWPQPEKKADITIYGFDELLLAAAEIEGTAAKIAEDTTRLRIFLARSVRGAGEGAHPFAVENRAIASLAGTFESPLVTLESKLERYGVSAASTSDMLATSILGIAASGGLSKHKLPRPASPPPPDLVEARALAGRPREFLEQLTWNDARAPRLLWTHASKESAEAFLDRKIVISETQSLDINVPITWPDDAEGRSAVADVFGLEFLSGPLNYWYSKANGRDSKKVVEVDAVIKQRGATASQILIQAGAIIADFVSKHPLSASAEWEEGAVSRRARVLALYLMCCRMAIKRKIKFDEAVCTQVICGLLDLVEVLRSEDFYLPCSFDGVQQDCLVVGLALVLRNTAYSQRLLRESLDRLVSCQIEPGLTADGVWRFGSFSDHCSLLTQFRTILSDFDKNDMAMLQPVASAAKKMTVFAEAMQKSNGSAPSFDSSSEKSFARKLSGTRRALASTGFAKSAPQRKVIPPRITDTYVFRDAQYFVSHSTLKVVPESSLVILHADSASFGQSDPGGVTLAFAYGSSDLLIRAEPPEGSRRDKKLGFDPALRNGYHINGVGRGADAPLNLNAARLEKSWRATGWAAARSVDETNPAGSVTRTVIHLKAEHALIVVDELIAAGGQEAAFEQFWHIAPNLTAPRSGSLPLRFDLAGKGGLTVMFDGPANANVEPEGEGSCIRHSQRFAKGLTVSTFQWSAEAAPLSFAAKGEAANWSVDISGAGFAGEVRLSAGELRYTPRAV